MDEQQFWNAIENHVSPSADGRDEALDGLQSFLKTLPRNEVVAFQRALNVVLARAYSWDLIGAACFLGCGQSDDGFEDFRAWLISKGRVTYERVLRDPGILAEFNFEDSPTEEWHLEKLHMLAGEIGGEEDDPDWPYSSDPDTPHGDPIELRQEALRTRFPSLWEKFGNRFMIGIS